ncbi:MAG: PBP1A family penicillin-binding protein [Bacteroidota bacterium]
MAKNVTKVKTKFKNLKRVLLTVFLSVSVITIIGGYFFMQYVIDGLPSLEQLENPKQSLASSVYSVDGELLGKFFIQNRIETSIDSIPRHVVQAFISSEDKEFFSHWGVHLERVFRAIFKTIFLNSRQGASTITQQLSKNLFGFKTSQESFYDTIVRKVREWIAAVQIEKNYTKNEILEMYFNESYFGHGIYGIGMASYYYFGKSASKLTIPEAAVLVGLNNLPVYYDPFRRYNNSLKKRNVVMNEIVEDGLLDRETYERFREEPIILVQEKEKQNFNSRLAPHFVEHIRRQLERMSETYGLNIYEDGLTIYTSVDSRMQVIAEKAVEEHLNEFQKQFDAQWRWTGSNRVILDELLGKAIKSRPEYIRAASFEERQEVYNNLKYNVAFVDSVQKNGQRIEVGFVVLDVKTGEIRAMVGGRDPEFGTGLNHVTQIMRQPGSSFKPIVYTVALDNGLYPAYPILNQPFDYNGWTPTNFVEDEVGGFLTLREAIKNSINLVAARLIIEGHVPLWQIGKYAQKMGITNKLNLFPSISVGASEVYPIELTSVFATIANKGIYNKPLSILSIEDKNGIVIEQFYTESREAITAETAYMITNMLESVVNEGTAVRIRGIHNFQRPAAGKTGTNTDYRDAWFVGFTPQLAAGVWVGFDDQRVSFTGAYGQGAKAAIPIWANFMRETYEILDLPIEYFEMPESGDIVTVDFCEESIYKFGDPRIVSKDCFGKPVRDIINISNIPPPFNAKKDTVIKIFDKYAFVDSNAHEAVEIIN